ncbi:hypothetical protein KA005_00845 [bacterium]|nr:hypothetical protein [bacterium]
MKLYFFSIIFAFLLISCATQKQSIPVTPKSQYKIDGSSVGEKENKESFIMSSERERYKVWIKCCEIDKKAGDEAHVGHPPFDDPASTHDDRMKVHAVYWELMEKYKKELAEELDIGLDSLESIISEGLRKEWTIE